MKNYKRQITIVSNCFALLLIALAFCASDAFAQKKSVDISCRPALYFGSKVLTDQRLKAPYVSAGNKIVLTPADSYNNEQGLYSFNVMYIIYGSPQAEAVALDTFFNRLRIGENLLSQHTIKFSNSDIGTNDTKLKYIVTQIKLPVGTSTITLSLDDDKKVTESNENNNSYKFTVEVNSKP